MFRSVRTRVLSIDPRGYHSMRLVLGALWAVAFVATVEAAETKIVLVGDSTVSGAVGQPTTTWGWGDVIQECFGDDVRIVNKARPGQSTKSFLDGGHWKNALAEKPDYVFIQFGHNDQKVNAGQRGTYPTDVPPQLTGKQSLRRSYCDNLRQMIAESRAIGAKPLLITSVARRNTISSDNASTEFDNALPSNGWADSFGNRFSLADYRDAARRVGEELGTPVIDLNSLSLDFYRQMQRENKSILPLGPEGDSTHFNREGAKAISRLIVKELLRQLPNEAFLQSIRPEAIVGGNLNGDHTHVYDVVIYGGASAAVTAAVQAARMGQSVVVVSPDVHVGGLTSGGLGWADFGKQNVIGGLSLEFYRRIWKYYQRPEAWQRQEREQYANGLGAQRSRIVDDEHQTMWAFEPHVAERTFDDWLNEHDIAVGPFGVAAEAGGLVIEIIGCRCCLSGARACSNGLLLPLFTHGSCGVWSESNSEQQKNNDDVHGYPGGAGPLPDVDDAPEKIPERGEDLEEQR